MLHRQLIAEGILNGPIDAGHGTGGQQRAQGKAFALHELPVGPLVCPALVNLLPYNGALFDDIETLGDPMRGRQDNRILWIIAKPQVADQIRQRLLLHAIKGGIALQVLNGRGKQRLGHRGRLAHGDLTCKLIATS